MSTYGTMGKTVSDIELARVYLAKVSSAKDRGIDFTLNLTSLKNILKAERCYYTGVKFSKRGENSRTIDRIDNTKGYVKGNVCACTKRINQAKGNMTLEEIQLISNKISKFLK